MWPGGVLELPLAGLLSTEESWLRLQSWATTRTANTPYILTSDPCGFRPSQVS